MLHIFHTYVASVLSRCCVSVAMVFQVFHVFYVSVSDACFKLSSTFRHMLQVVSRCFKRDWVLQRPPRLLLPRLGVSSLPSVVLHPSQTTEGTVGEVEARGAPGHGGTNASARSPLMLHG